MPATERNDQSQAESVGPTEGLRGPGLPKALLPPCQGRPCPCPPRRVREVCHGLRCGQPDLQGHRALPCVGRAQLSDTLSWVWGSALLIKLPKVTDVGWGGVGRENQGKMTWRNIDSRFKVLPAKAITAPKCKSTGRHSSKPRLARNPQLFPGRSERWALGSSERRRQSNNFDLRCRVVHAA